jgi:hypothetical protein
VLDEGSGLRHLVAEQLVGVAVRFRRKLAEHTAVAVRDGASSHRDSCVFPGEVHETGAKGVGREAAGIPVCDSPVQLFRRTCRPFPTPSRESAPEWQRPAFQISRSTCVAREARLYKSRTPAGLVGMHTARGDYERPFLRQPHVVDVPHGNELVLTDLAGLARENRCVVLAAAERADA